MPANQQMQLSRRLMLSPTGKLMAKKSVIRRPVEARRSRHLAETRSNSSCRLQHPQNYWSYRYKAQKVGSCGTITRAL